MKWTIEKELSAMGPPAGITPAWLGLAGTGSISFRELVGWHRSGAETFSYVFLAETAEAQKTLIAKACVAFSLASPPDAQAENWNLRRQRIREHGGGTPALLGATPGLFVEEFLPYELTDVVGLGSAIRNAYCDLINAVLDAGFLPRDFARNIRSDGRTVYWIDFGEDLGGLRTEPIKDRSKIIRKAMEEFDTMDANLAPRLAH